MFASSNGRSSEEKNKLQILCEHFVNTWQVSRLFKSKIKDNKARANDSTPSPCNIS